MSKRRRSRSITGIKVVTSAVLPEHTGRPSPSIKPARIICERALNPPHLWASNSPQFRRVARPSGACPWRTGGGAVVADAGPPGQEEGSALMMILELHRQGLTVSAIAPPTRHGSQDGPHMCRARHWSRPPMAHARPSKGAPIRFGRICASGLRPIPVSRPYGCGGGLSRAGLRRWLSAARSATSMISTRSSATGSTPSRTRASTRPRNASSTKPLPRRSPR